jgi:hypothetical protein
MNPVTLTATQTDQTLTALRVLVVEHLHHNGDSILRALRTSGFEVQHTRVETREDFRECLPRAITT